MTSPHRTTPFAVACCAALARALAPAPVSAQHDHSHGATSAQAATGAPAANHDHHAATPAAAGQDRGGAPAARAAFERLKSLAGHWNGSMQGQSYSLDYRVASGGSVVMATLFPGTDHEMITMFHLDGEELVATHYCSGGNQPHMRFDAAGSTADELRFAFVDGTNMKPGDPHIHEGLVRIGADGKLHEEWAAFAGGEKADTKVFDLTR